jgi:hypothetical protein
MPIVIKLIDEALREKLQCGLQAMTPNIRSRATLSSANVAVLAKQNLVLHIGEVPGYLVAQCGCRWEMIVVLLRKQPDHAGLFPQ